MESRQDLQDKEHLSGQADRLIVKYAYGSSLTGFILFLSGYCRTHAC
jgi:hypothetical protein